MFPKYYMHSSDVATSTMLNFVIHHEKVKYKTQET